MSAILSSLARMNECHPTFLPDCSGPLRSGVSLSQPSVLFIVPSSSRQMGGGDRCFGGKSVKKKGGKKQEKQMKNRKDTTGIIIRLFFILS